MALRARGVATTLTTLLCRVEPAVREIIGLPATWSTACHIVAGYPEAPFPTRLRRAPVEKLAFVDGWGAALGRS
jgi:hypothetical protein